MTIRVAQITDLHLTATAGVELYGVDTGRALERVIHAINGLPKPPDLVIATGDLAENGSLDTYRRLQHLLAAFNVPVYVLPGNHDDATNMRHAFDSGNVVFTATAAMADWGFVFVESQVRNQSHGLVNLSELENHLDSFDGRPVLVALHHTPTDICPSFDCQLVNATEITALFECTRQCQMRHCGSHPQHF